MGRNPGMLPDRLSLSEAGGLCPEPAVPSGSSPVEQWSQTPLESGWARSDQQNGADVRSRACSFCFCPLQGSPGRKADHSSPPHWEEAQAATPKSGSVPS